MLGVVKIDSNVHWRLMYAGAIQLHSKSNTYI